MHMQVDEVMLVECPPGQHFDSVLSWLQRTANPRSGCLAVSEARVYGTSGIYMCLTFQIRFLVILPVFRDI